MDTTFRTKYGYGVSHTGYIYGNTNGNFSLALRRLTGCKTPGVSGASAFLYRSYDKMLKQNQRDTIAEMGEWLDAHAIYFNVAYQNMGPMEEEMLEHAGDPHPKRRLREEGRDELETSNLIAQKLWLKSCLYKMKKDEWAKILKYPRSIGDMGVCASLQGFRVIENLKHTQASRVWKMREMEGEFIDSPQPERLEEVFAKLMNPPKGGYLAFFSDDSCLSVHTKEGVSTWNKDLKSCDASHTGALFEMSYRQAPVAKSELKRLVAQCELPIRIHSLDNPKEMVLLEPNEPTLYSGSTMTTYVNNNAEFVLLWQYSKIDFSKLTRKEAEAAIHAAAAKAGYQISLEFCPKPGDIQFLKHSPVRNERGDLKPLLNLGTLLRLSGTCKRDLPGKGTMEERACAFQKSLLRGIYVNTSFNLIDRMRSICAKGRVTNQQEEATKELLLYKTAYTNEVEYNSFSDECIAERYRLTPCEMEELNERLGSCGYGQTVHTSATSKILERDYGLATH